MFIRKRNKSVLKAMISLVLCIAIMFNTGCQSTNQSTNSPRKEKMLSFSTQAKIQEVETPKVTGEKPPQESNGFSDTLDGVGKFVGDTANFTGRVALVGAVVVGAMFVDYQAWRLADKMF